MFWRVSWSLRSVFCACFLLWEGQSEGGQLVWTVESYASWIWSLHSLLQFDSGFCLDFSKTLWWHVQGLGIPSLGGILNADLCIETSFTFFSTSSIPTACSFYTCCLLQEEELGLFFFLKFKLKYSWFGSIYIHTYTCMCVCVCIHIILLILPSFFLSLFHSLLVVILVPGIISHFPFQLSFFTT